MNIIRMNKIFLLIIIYLLNSSTCFAIKITLFSNTDRFIKQAKDIIIAKCIVISDDNKMYNDMNLYDIKVLKIIKGDKEIGNLKIATIYPLEKDGLYMLMSLGGSVSGTDFLAIPELSVIPIPSNFDLDILNSYDTRRQVQTIFSRYLFEIERKLEPLNKEKELLEKAIIDSTYDIFTIYDNIEINTTTTIQSKNEKKIIYLDINSEKLNWSQSEPGKSVFFYFTEVGLNNPIWEFSLSDKTEIEELNGKPLKIKFYGMYSPERKKVFNPQWSPNAIFVGVG